MARGLGPGHFHANITSVKSAVCVNDQAFGLAIYVGMGYGGKRYNVLILIWTEIILELVIASVEDVNTLPAAIIYFFEAAHFTHLNTSMAGWYIRRNRGGHRKYSLF